MTKFTYNQLIENLQYEKDKAPKDWDCFLSDIDFIDIIDFSHKLLELELPEKPLSERLGIKKESFPLSEELEEDEIKTIVNMILDLWEHYHYFAAFPDGLPYRIAYSALVSVWDEPVMCLSLGHLHFDFTHLELDQYVKPK